MSIICIIASIILLMVGIILGVATASDVERPHHESESVSA